MTEQRLQQIELGASAASWGPWLLIHELAVEVRRLRRIVQTYHLEKAP